ncbi:MAG: hypothetical protein R3F28_05225 [Candidatus Kapaibacterium sp.]
MHSRFEAIYTLLSEEYVEASDTRKRQSSPSSILVLGYSMATEVRDRIERAIGQTGVNVRSDARYFLLVNFTEIVLEPLVADQENTLEIEAILDDIEKDTVRILNDAMMTHREEKLGGGEVLISLSKLYPRLNVSRYRLWN